MCVCVCVLVFVCLCVCVCVCVCCIARPVAAKSKRFRRCQLDWKQRSKMRAEQTTKVTTFVCEQAVLD